MTEADAVSSQPSFLLVVGGDPSCPVWLPGGISAGTIVVAADSGLDVASRGGVVVHHVVGDLDSASPDTVRTAEGAGARVHRHPADKDATDIELALDLVDGLAASVASVEEMPPRLLVVGPGGGRQDHSLADIFVVASPRLARFEVTARFGAAEWLVVRPGSPRRFTGAPHEQLSILPVHGGARGVTTHGLRWPLTGAELAAGTTRGMSNELTGREASVSVDSGVLLVVRPGGRAAPVRERTTPYDPSPHDPSQPPRNQP